MDLLNKVKQAIQGMKMDFIKPAQQTLGNYFTAPVTAKGMGNNQPINWGQATNNAVVKLGQSPVGKTLVNIQKSTPAWQQGGMNAFGVNNFINNNRSITDYVPQFQAPKNAGTVSKVIAGAANIPGQIGSTIVGKGIIDPTMDLGKFISGAISGRGTSYSSLKSPLARLESNIAGEQRTPQQILGNVAGVAEAPLFAYGGGKLFGLGSDASKQVIKQTFLNIVKDSAIGGAKFNSVFGILDGLANNRDGSLVNQLVQAAKGGTFGAATGALFGAGLGAGGYAFGKVFNAVAKSIAKNRPELNPQEVIVESGKYLRNKLGQFSGFNKVTDFISGGAKGKYVVKGNQPIKITEGGKTVGWMNRVDKELGIDKLSSEKGFIKLNAKVGQKPLVQGGKGKSLEQLMNEAEGFKPGEKKILDMQTEAYAKAFGAKNIVPEVPPTIQSPKTVKPISTVSQPEVFQQPQMGQAQGLTQTKPLLKSPMQPRQSSDSIIQKVKDKVNSIYTASLDRFHPLSQLAKQGKQEQAMQNALTGHYGAGSIGKYHTDFELSPILKSVNADDLRVYTIAQRDIELAGRNIQGSNTGNATKTIEALKQKYGGDLSGLDTAATKLYDYQKNLVQKYLVDTGIISKENFNAMTSKNQKYVPFKRVMDQVDEYLGNVPQAKGAGSVGSQNVIKGIKGSERQIKDPLESIIENTYKIVGLGKRQQVAQTIVGLEKDLPKGIIKPVGNEGYTTMIVKGVDGKAEYRKVLKPEFLQKPDVISLFKGGKRVAYHVPIEVADAAKGLSEQGMNILVKILGAPTRVFRQTATGANPEFALPNVARDLQSSFVNIGLNPFKFVSGLAHYMKKDTVYQEFLKSGGLTSRISLDQPFLKQSVKDLTGIKSKGLRLLDPRKIYSTLQAIGQASEQPTRIAAFQKVYNQALKQGLPIAEAQSRGAYAAQEATVNFARRGSVTQPVNAIYAFLNARAQGVDRLVRSIKGDPVGVGTRIGFITVAPAIALYAYNRNFQSYNDPRIVPEYEKQNNFIIMLSDKPVDQLGGAQYIKIPKGDIGKIANPLEAFMSYADGKGGDVGSALKSVLAGFSPITNMGDLIPTALRPPLENAANYSFFQDRPIVSESKKNYPAQFQYDKSTPAVYKEIGAKIGQSPAMIGNLIRGYLTGFARIGEMMTEPFAKQDTYSGQDINKIPVARRFLGGAVRTEDEQALNEYFQQKGIMDKVQDIKTGIKYGNIPLEDGYNEINKLLDETEKLQTKQQSYLGPRAAEATNVTTQRSKLEQDRIKLTLESGRTPNAPVSTQIIDGEEVQGYISGNKFIFINKDEGVSTKSLDVIKKQQISDQNAIRNSQYTLDAQRALRANDYSAWMKASTTQLQALQDYQKTLDPKADQAKINTLQNQIEDLQVNITKYKGYGGLKKGKKLKVIKLKLPKFKTIKVKSIKPKKIKVYKMKKTKKLTKVKKLT